MTWESALCVCLVAVVGCGCVRWLTAGVRDAVVTVVAVKARAQGASPAEAFLKLLQGGSSDDRPKKSETDEVKS